MTEREKTLSENATDGALRWWRILCSVHITPIGDRIPMQPEHWHLGLCLSWWWKEASSAHDDDTFAAFQTIALASDPDQRAGCASPPHANTNPLTLTPQRDIALLSQHTCDAAALAGVELACPRVITSCVGNDELDVA